jgi:hypothetical protein
MPTKTLRRGRARTQAAATTVRVWEDDPMSTGAVPVERAVPKLPSGRMKVSIDVPAPPAQPYEPGTPEFRYWVAVDALQRGVAFWSPLLPRGTIWQSGPTLAVRLDFGDRLNASYTRFNLNFFHATVDGTTIYTGESPDVLNHELGHAVLDAVAPQLWNAMSHEVAGFHEAFGDISSILTALQQPSVRERVMAETGGKYRASRISRVAEQMGWGLRQRRPCGVEPDCLRNAVNCFAYQPPDQLPLIAPAAMLSSEPHSLSRVFTGAFFEMFAGMLVTLNRQPTADDLRQATVDAAKLLIAAVRSATVTPTYFSQIAGAMLEADEDLFEKKYADAVDFGFSGRGIVSTPSVARTPRPAIRVAAATGPSLRPVDRARELPLVSLSAADFGLGDRPLRVRAAGEPARLAITPAGLDGSPLTPPSAERAARSFFAELLAGDRVQLPGRPSPDDLADDGPLRTHEVVEEDGALAVVRRLFECS